LTIAWPEGSGSITVNNQDLEWACWGPPPSRGPVIVMLHEGLGCVALWRDFPATLAKATGCGVFAYSRAGYGFSSAAVLPRPLDYMTQEAIDVLPAVLNQIGAKKIVLFGHSDGATIAAIYAGSVEDFRVRGLVLMAPHFFTEDMGLAEIAEAKANYSASDLGLRMAKYHRDPAATFKGWNDAWLDPGFKSWNVADVIDYLRIPVLAIQGRQDQYGTKAQIEELDSRIYSPLDITWIEDCRHSPHQEQPETTLAAVTDFVARLQRLETEKVAV